MFQLDIFDWLSFQKSNSKQVFVDLGPFTLNKITNWEWFYSDVSRTTSYTASGSRPQSPEGHLRSTMSWPSLERQSGIINITIHLTTNAGINLATNLFQHTYGIQKKSRSAAINHQTALTGDVLCQRSTQVVWNQVLKKKKQNDIHSGRKDYWKT